MIRAFQPVEIVTIGVFRDQRGDIFGLGEEYPGIVFSYDDKITQKMPNLMAELNVTIKDLSLVNFEELEDRFNALVIFDIRREVELVLVAEVEVNKKTIEQFKKAFQRTKVFVICFGFCRPWWDVEAIIEPWHVMVDRSPTAYSHEKIKNDFCQLLIMDFTEGG